MQFAFLLRPVVISLLGASVASCGMVDDPHRFENLANRVASIPLDGGAPASTDAPVRTAGTAGLRPAMHQALRVEVMDPHDLWDARDAGLRGAVVRAAPAMIEAAAPAVAEAVVQRVSQPIAAKVEPLRAALPRARTTIQLGAFSTASAARSAWSAAQSGPARQALSGLQPLFETVQVDGRSLTRLKVSAPADSASAICRAARVSDPWCLRRG